MSILDLKLKQALTLSEQECAECNLEPIPRFFGLGFPLYKNKTDEYIYLGAMDKKHSIDWRQVCAKPGYRAVHERLKIFCVGAEKPKTFYKNEAVMYAHPDIVESTLEVWLSDTRKKLTTSAMEQANSAKQPVGVAVSPEDEPVLSSDEIPSDSTVAGKELRPAKRLAFAFRSDNITFMRRLDEPYIFVTPFITQHKKKWSNFKIGSKYKQAVEEMHEKYGDEPIANFVVTKGERKYHGMYVHVGILVDVMQYCTNSKCANIATALVAYVSSKEFSRLSTQRTQEIDVDDAMPTGFKDFADALSSLPEEARSDAYSKGVEAYSRSIDTRAVDLKIREVELKSREVDLKIQQTKLAMAQLRHSVVHSKSEISEDDDDDDDEVEEEAEDESIPSGTKRRKTQH